MTCDEVHSNIDRYVDSQLDPASLADFESHLRTCPQCANETRELLRLKLLTRSAALRYTPSPDFRMRIEQQIRQSRPRRFWSNLRFPSLVAAACLAVVLIVSIVIFQYRDQRERALAELTDLHVATLASANPADVLSSDRHTVKPWFAGKIPFTFNVPELQNTDFTLVGGRVAYFEHRPGAQLLFTLRKHQFSVFIFREESVASPFHTTAFASTRLEFHMESWTYGGLRYFIVSDAAASDVHRLSELMRTAARS